MKLSESGECGQRNNHCWRAILDAIEQWSPETKGGELEARFGNDLLTLTFSEPDKNPITAQIDIAWIAYADQADRFGRLTRAALLDIEKKRLSRRGQERAAEPVLPINRDYRLLAHSR